VVTITTAIHGWPVLLADTAGLRKTSDELESAGVALAGSAIQQADLVLVVSDASATDTTTDAIETHVPSSARVLRVANKIDLVDELTYAAGPFDNLRVSALTGQGIAELIDAIETTLVPCAPPAGSAIAFTHAQIRALQVARHAVGYGDAQAAGFALAAMLATGADPERTS
jgi:tRNA modification GTPase